MKAYVPLRRRRGTRRARARGRLARRRSPVRREDDTGSRDRSPVLGGRLAALPGGDVRRRRSDRTPPGEAFRHALPSMLMALPAVGPSDHLAALYYDLQM